MRSLWFAAATKSTGCQRPLLKPVFCFVAPQTPTLAAGAIWVIAGGLYVVLKTRASGRPIVIDFSESGG
jgi:hypothetical protein